MTEDLNSYLPLFRKYRPQSFKDVIGQEFTVKALMNAIKLNKIANAYLFCGPRGTGKTSSARIFAKSLNCKEGPTVDPCQKCQSCLDVTNASGLDVIEIDAATNRGIDDAKELISKVQYAPMNGKYKIFIIDEVHMLSKEAFNALLKTFEEPPKNVIFILATTEPHKVIETIVSRCQRFDFRRITIDDIVKRLREISDIEKINITDEALYTIAKNVSGGMRDSLALLDQASILGIEKEITKETIESLTGKLTFDVLFDLTLKILNNEINEAFSAVEKIYEKGLEPRNFIENYIEFLRNTILILNSKNDEEVSNLTLINKEDIKKIKGNTLFDSNKLLLMLDKIIEIYKEIKVSTNPYLWAEIAIMTCNISSGKVQTTVKETIQTPVIPVAPIAKEIIKQEPAKDLVKEEPVKAEPVKIETIQEPVIKEIIEQPKVEEKPAVSEIQPVQAEAAINEGDPAKIWSEILNKVESIPAKFFYSGVGKLVSIQDKHITLGFVNQNAIAQAKSDNKYNPLTKAIKGILGEDGSIDFITINQNTKIIDTKINVKIAQNAPQAPVRQEVQNSSFNKEPENFGNTSKQSAPKEDDTEEKIDITSYPQTTREMLETFNGRVIE